ncbi:hydroxyisourate hydrolase [Alteromonas sp. C1M14]|uniref:hydroxyisourate hydrolase n=1 Tax=Alteromonas sp. C1M14 TaxID=2841567 RepID=UPI001C08B475|nr:hydroxyisourate hydrolase [Alteromonas sp. C1M14]MBU2978924.1 hydroxyisourate hydrolase [Alteromonas sp. C1M14]
MITLSSHVLDTTLGKPAKKLPLSLTLPDGSMHKGITDDDGRCKTWGELEFLPGAYHLRFHCEAYLLEKHGESFYPFVDIHFTMEENGGHYHVPLLISPFGFSSYRGS